jgi:hypothetical protein
LILNSIIDHRYVFVHSHKKTFVRKLEDNNEKKM